MYDVVGEGSKCLNGTKKPKEMCSRRVFCGMHVFYVYSYI